MTTHKLQIFNQSGVAKSYTLFMQPPEISSSGGETQIFANAWITFESITSGGFDIVTYDSSIYAYWGTTPDTLAPGTVVGSGGVALIDLAQQNAVTFTGGPPTGFGDIAAGSAPPASFAIIAAADFTPASGFVFGWAKAATSPIPVAVATVSAQPNTIYTFTPTSRVYVTEYVAVPGQVVDVAEISNPVVVDFTGLPQTTATVIQAANGSFTIEYTE